MRLVQLFIHGNLNSKLFMLDTEKSSLILVGASESPLLMKSKTKQESASTCRLDVCEESFITKSEDENIYHPIEHCEANNHCVNESKQTDSH